eukprot:6225050-Alexandrium_andersonii.AAC.1
MQAWKNGAPQNHGDATTCPSNGCRTILGAAGGCAAGPSWAPRGPPPLQKPDPAKNQKLTS